MPTQRRIGINALYLIPGGVGGTEIYLRNLLDALSEADGRNQYFVFTNRETGDDLCPRAENFTHVPSVVPARIRPLRLIWEQTALPIQSFRYKLDVLFSPGFSSPWICRGGRVSVIHDLQHKRQPENFGLLERWAWNAVVWSSVRFSDLLVAVSENSRRDVTEIYGTPRERVRAIPHGVEPAFFQLQNDAGYTEAMLREAGVPACPYLLAVSTVHPHKNWFRLLDAYERLVEDGRPEHLVIAGLRGKAWRPVERRLSKSALGSRVHLLGWQPRPVLLALYKFAEALVFPSTFEGFGMPVLEAMAAGVPVACSDIPPLRETADGVAAFFDPKSAEDMVAALAAVLDEPWRWDAMSEKGRARAAPYTWQAAAEKTLAALLETARR
jgi:glycosyltransferase involved in cell wall biosynthesis